MSSRVPKKEVNRPGFTGDSVNRVALGGLSLLSAIAGILILDRRDVADHPESAALPLHQRERYTCQTRLPLQHHSPDSPPPVARLDHHVVYSILHAVRYVDRNRARRLV